jgi:hypothetical protein
MLDHRLDVVLRNSARFRKRFDQLCFAHFSHLDSFNGRLICATRRSLTYPAAAR